MRSCRISIINSMNPVTAGGLAHLCACYWGRERCAAAWAAGPLKHVLTLHLAPHLTKENVWRNTGPLV